MDGENGKLFRKSLFGFNKNDVLDFIAGENEKRDAERQELLADADRLQKEIADLKDQNSKLTAAKEKTETELSAAAKEAERIRSAAESERREYEARIKTLETRSAELAVKADEYDKAKESLIEIELRARRHASDIEKEAQDEVKRIKAEADEYLKSAEAEFAEVLRSADEQNHRAEAAMTAYGQKMAELSSGASAVAAALRGIASGKSSAAKGDIPTKNLPESENSPVGVRSLMDRLRSGQSKRACDASSPED